MSAIAGLVVELLYSLFVEVLLVWTGELLRYGFTLGRRKPCLQFWQRGMASRVPVPVNPSLLPGLVFWIAVFVGVTVWSVGS
jgi:hypothetical protein